LNREKLLNKEAGARLSHYLTEYVVTFRTDDGGETWKPINKGLI